MAVQCNQSPIDRLTYLDPYFLVDSVGDLTLTALSHSVTSMQCWYWYHVSLSILESIE